MVNYRITLSFSQGETGVVFYLTLDVLETDCHVLSKKNWKDCETQGPEQYPVCLFFKMQLHVLIDQAGNNIFFHPTAVWSV